jgi:hypothetical protein
LSRPEDAGSPEPAPESGHPVREVAMTRVVGVVLGFALAVVLIGFYVSDFLLYQPPLVTDTTNIVLQTVPAYGHEPNPDWVSYFVQDSSGKWQHSTFFKVPAHSTIHVTIYNFDGSSGLRNPLWSQVRGTGGGTINLDGKDVDSIAAADPGHTFAIPDLGLSVPLQGIPDSAQNVCDAGPCDLNKFDHTTTTFTFQTEGPGEYRWQCFVPCAAGFFQGFGGPMQTLGYMDGEMYVQ